MNANLFQLDLFVQACTTASSIRGHGGSKLQVGGHDGQGGHFAVMKEAIEVATRKGQGANGGGHEGQRYGGHDIEEGGVGSYRQGEAITEAIEAAMDFSATLENLEVVLEALDAKATMVVMEATAEAI